jgi:hypothetical protein
MAAGSFDQWLTYGTPGQPGGRSRYSNWVTSASALCLQGSRALMPGTSMREFPSAASEASWPYASTMGRPRESYRPPTIWPRITSVVFMSVWYRMSIVFDRPFTYVICTFAVV